MYNNSASVRNKGIKTSLPPNLLFIFFLYYSNNNVFIGFVKNIFFNVLQVIAIIFTEIHTKLDLGFMTAVHICKHEREKYHKAKTGDV